MYEPQGNEAADNGVAGEQVSNIPPGPWQMRNLVAPLKIRFWQAALEAVLGWFLLVGIASTIQPGILNMLLLRPSFPSVSAVAAVLGWIWAVCWPVWRMRQSRGSRFWVRLPLGAVRVGLLGTVVGLACLGLIALRELWPGDLGAVHNDGGLVPSFIFLMLFCRTGLDIAVAVRRWARTRLRRQLTVSYLFVIMVTFVGAMGIGSVVTGLTIALNLPDPASQARATAEMLQPGDGGTAVNPVRAQQLLQAVAAERIRPFSYGGSPLNLLIPWGIISRRIELVDAQGKLLAAVNVNQSGNTCVVQHPNDILPSAGRRTLIETGLAGHTGTAKVPYGTSCSSSTAVETAAAAPIWAVDKNGIRSSKPIAVVLVRGQTLSLTWNQIIGALLVGFTFAIIVLVLITSLPTLGLSFLAAMYFARGLTKGLSAMSGTAEALASGDLTQRVPVTARNEIGRLATDFNRMAERLEANMTELRGARRQAEQALQARQELVANVSHELRTPIAIVQAHLETLNDHSVQGEGTSEEVPTATMQALRSEMDRLITLVDDLFTLARASTDVMTVQCVPTDVGAIVRDIASLLRPLAQREGSVMLTTEIAPGLPQALADGDRLRQILANLVRNAVRHTPEGGIIALAVTADDRSVVINVADTGEGIAPEHLPHIFERFYRADKARTRASGGAGLGLAIVKEFVELMGGQVTAESVVGEGTCFRVHLPLAPKNQQ